MGFNPLVSFVRFVWMIVSRRIRFPRGEVGRVLSLGGKGHFIVFRHAVVRDGRSIPGRPAATFIVRFRVAGMSPEANRRFSLLTIPFFAGLPGFCSKRWLIDVKTGEFAGYYGWRTRADAERYAASFAVRFMTHRATPGSVSYEIRDNTEEIR
jgi:hypothetical protein